MEWIGISDPAGLMLPGYPVAGAILTGSMFH
jgi:hypothetical protein